VILHERAQTRRTFIARGGSAAFAAALPIRLLSRHRRLSLRSHLRRSAYHGLVGQRFSVSGTRMKLRLLAVEDLNKHQAGSDHAFALVFRASRGASRIANQVPTLYHPSLGSFALLIAPGAPSRKGQPYAAIINRLHA
jgi:hypothetical protein